MRKSEEVLYLLASFNMRVGMVDKALAYARAGARLFPSYLPLTEILAATLILKGQLQDAEDILSSTAGSSRNLSLVRSQTAILLGLPKDQQQERIRGYLQTKAS